MQRVEIEHDFALPVERVYAYLSEHENLGPLFGATITRVRDGDTSRNGTGSVRRLRVGLDRLVKRTLQRSITRGLTKVDESA